MTMLDAIEFLVIATLVFIGLSVLSLIIIVLNQGDNNENPE